jgi:hypothetical protein
MSHADAWLRKFRVFWAARLQALKAMLESETSSPIAREEKDQ